MFKSVFVRSRLQLSLKWLRGTSPGVSNSRLKLTTRQTTKQERGKAEEEDEEEGGRQLRIRTMRMMRRKQTRQRQQVTMRLKQEVWRIKEKVRMKQETQGMQWILQARRDEQQPSQKHNPSLTPDPQQAANDRHGASEPLQMMMTQNPTKAARNPRQNRMKRQEVRVMMIPPHLMRMRKRLRMRSSPNPNVDLEQRQQQRTSHRWSQRRRQKVLAMQRIRRMRRSALKPNQRGKQRQRQRQSLPQPSNPLTAMIAPLKCQTQRTTENRPPNFVFSVCVAAKQRGLWASKVPMFTLCSSLICRPTCKTTTTGNAQLLDARSKLATPRLPTFPVRPLAMAPTSYCASFGFFGCSW